jgi:hypothetical protein
MSFLMESEFLLMWCENISRNAVMLPALIGQKEGAMTLEGQ